MKYFEFGKENEKLMVLLHGGGVCYRGAVPAAQVLAKEFHVIVVAYDGFNPSEPETEFKSVMDEAQRLGDYIVENYGGKIDILYSLSYGCRVLVEVLADKRLTITTAIADGMAVREYPNIKSKLGKDIYCFFFTGLFYVMMAKAGPGRKKFLAKITGRTLEEAERLLYQEATWQSWKNQDYCLIGRSWNVEAFKNTDMYIWHGVKCSVEKKLAKGIKEWQDAGYDFTYRVFTNVGHGGLVGEHTEKFMEEVKATHQSSLEKRMQEKKMKKIKIEKNTISETLVIPLYGRAHCSKKYPEVFSEPEAERIVNMVDYDFEALNYKEFMMMTWAVRKRMLCDKAKEYLKKHPRATIVNLGCGADVSFTSVDNGQCHWINLDLPEVIEAREKLVSCREREKNVAMDAFDTAWFDEIETPIEDGVYVISGGVFMYFDEEVLRKLFTELAKRFPGGGICFDACNSAGLKKSNRVVKKSGNTGAPVKLAVDDAKKLFLPWSKNFREVNNITELPEDMKTTKSLPWMSKFILNMGMKMKMIQIVEILFQ